MQTQKTFDLRQREAQYGQLKAKLGQTGWISQGYVQDRGPGAGGPCYQWTRKVKGKTVSVALSKEQYHWLKQAIANWRELQRTLKQMQQLSRQVLFETVPGTQRRKRLSKRVLGLISEHCTCRISVRYQFEHHSQLGAWKDGFCGVEFLRHFGRQLIRTSIAEVMQVHG